MFIPTNFQAFEHMTDVVMIISTSTDEILYLNKIGHRFFGITDHTSMKANEVVEKHGVYRRQHEKIRDAILNDGEYVAEGLTLTSATAGNFTATVHIGYFDDDKSAIYLILKNSDDKATIIDTLIREQSLFEAVQSFSEDTIFRLNLETQVMQYIGKKGQDTLLPPILTSFPQSLIDLGIIYEPDESIFEDLADQMYSCVDGSAKFRAYEVDGSVQWFHTEYVICKNGNGVPFEAIGKITNIQKQIELEFQARTDILTGCLTKVAFEDKSKSILKRADASMGIHTFFIVDIDNFKAVNDNLGHHFGDIVLKDIGERLRSVFRDGDYVGRIGGDEFMVCIRNLDNNAVIERKAQEVLEICNNTYKGNTKEYKISGSIGIAKYPADGTDFKTLYKNSDAALYACKNAGKNNFMFYNEKFLKGTMDNDAPLQIATRSLEQHFDFEIITDVFNLLFEAKDFEASLITALKRIGSRFGVERSYIIEYDGEHNCYNNTYEACLGDAPALQSEFQDIPSSVIDHLVSLANDSGIFYCNDLRVIKNEQFKIFMQTQKVKSFIHSYIIRDEKVKYILGFDEMQTARIWSPIEINSLLYIGRIIAQVLEYKKTANLLENSYKEHLSLLDELSYYAYIIENDTYELKFFNKSIENLVGGLEIGDICYEKIRGRTQPCEDCLINAMKSNNKPKMQDVIKDDRLGVTVLANATALSSFKGKKSTFISCCNLNETDVNTKDK